MASVFHCYVLKEARTTKNLTPGVYEQSLWLWLGAVDSFEGVGIVFGCT